MASLRSGKQYFSVFLVLIAAYWQQLVSGGEPQVPCFFIFGDSLVDSGNNNNLPTEAKVNYPPYGIDFPNGPTGRFCNGRTTADIIGELLGFDGFIPPFLTANGSEILKGVNYGSGSAGIRYDTGKQLGANIYLNQQLQHHQVTMSHIANLLGSKDSASEHLNQCFYSIVIGSNDYINNYFMPKYYNTSRQYTPEQYAEVLIQEYSEQIMILYNSGARKVALTGIGPIGCTPYAMAYYDTNGSLCVDYMNSAANIFNDRLQLLVNELNANLKDAKFMYLNTYGIVPHYPASPGIEIKITGCCKVNENGLCIPDAAPCLIRPSHLFWDSFHPSQAANWISATVSYLDLKKFLGI